MNRKSNANCVVCKKPIYKRPSSNSPGYCSKACYGKSCRKEVECRICKAPILKGLHKVTCSKECFKIYNSVNNTERSRARQECSTDFKRGLDTKSAREAIFKDRDHKCEACGYNKNKNLIIHHIVERCNGGNHKPNNLLLLCPNCHGELHKQLPGPALELHNKKYSELGESGLNQFPAKEPAL